MPKTYRKIFYTFLLLLVQSLASAQDLNVAVYHFSINNGLSQNTASHVMQDKRGFLWISSQDGISMYNGYNFTNHRHNPTNPNSLSNNYVNMICESSDSALWIATQSGLNRFNFNTKEFKAYLNDPAKPNSIRNNSIDYIFEDSKKMLWIKTKYGISRYNPGSDDFTFYRHKYDEFSYPDDQNHYNITETENRYLWVATKDGIARFDKQNEQFAYFYPEQNNKTTENEIFCIYVEDDDTFWIAADKGLYKFNPKINKFRKIPFHSDSAQVRTIFKDSKGVIWLGTETGLATYDRLNNSIVNYLPSDINNFPVVFGRVSSITQDSSEILWIGTQNGLFKIDRKSKKFKTLRKGYGFGPQLSSNRIYSIFVDDQDRIWLGTRGYGLNIIEPHNKKIRHYTKENSQLKDNDIHCIQQDRTGKISIGTSYGAYFFDPATNNFISFAKYFNKKDLLQTGKNRISKIILDSKGHYWFATNNGLYVFDGENIKSITDEESRKNSNEVQTFSVLERQNGDIWAASTIGLTRIMANTGQIKYYTKENSGLSNNSCMSLYESSDNTLWVGTETGLNRFLDDKEIFSFYTQASHNFTNDYIYSITEDNKKNLWFSTNRGLTKFSPATGQVQNYSPEDGLQGYEYNIGAVFKKSNGELYFGGVNGLNIFDPDNMPIYTKAPKPIITSFEKMTPNGKKTVPFQKGEIIQLKSNERSFTIHFSMPEYTHPHRNKYKYKIKELNKEWSLINENFVNYNYLSPGEYTFQVKGANSDDFWNENPAELQIIIQTPWWRTYFAFTMYFFSSVIFLYTFVRFYNRKIRNENKFLQEQQKASKQIAEQREQLEQKNQNINDSIHYAKRIIDAMIPSKNIIKKLLPESFILFMPKDIVSGDFYWIDAKDNKIFVAAADCTGHGVPGAFMSIIGLDLLRDILSLGIESPAEILDRLNSEVSKIFKNDQNDSNVRDGMDIAICAIDKKNKILEFAGAVNPLYLIRDNEITETKGDRFSIGPVAEENRHKKFKNNVINLQENDVIYMFSDGYADQFGGSYEKKFKFRRFRHTLLNMYGHDFEYQKLTLLETFHNWKGETEQVDDVLVLGIKPLAE